MKAAERLYLNAARTKLVSEGHPDGAVLYAAPGDDIPDSAVELFGLVDGLVGEGKVLDVVEAILRVAAIGVHGAIEVAGLVFTIDWREFGEGQLDEAQLLAILKEPVLAVEGVDVDEPGGWLAFPGRDLAIEILQARVDYDIANGRPHDLIEKRGEDDVLHPADVAHALAEQEAREAEEQRATEARAAEEAAKAAAAATAAPSLPTEATNEVPVTDSNTPAPAKEGAPTATKEAKPAPNKEAKASANKAKGD